jgi:hypothetical protein
MTYSVKSDRCSTPLTKADRQPSVLFRHKARPGKTTLHIDVVVMEETVVEMQSRRPDKISRKEMREQLMDVLNRLRVAMLTQSFEHSTQTQTVELTETGWGMRRHPSVSSTETKTGASREKNLPRVVLGDSIHPVG